MPGLKIAKTVEGETTLIHFTGNINEDADFSSVKAINTPKVILDFEKITAINSCGIREWVEYVEELDHRIELVYRNCPQVIIEQINMVSGFIKDGAKVESFYAPYFCPKCDEEKKIHLSSVEVENEKAPTVNCDECGSELEFDALEKQYLRFLN